MKTRLVIIIVLSVSLGMSFAYAVPELDYSQAFEYSDFVIIGKIILVDIISEPIIHENANRPGVAMYEIEVLETKKSLDPESKQYPMGSEFFYIPGTFLREPHGMSYDTYPYEVGQVGIFYIQKNTNDYIDDELVIRSGNSKLIEPPPPSSCRDGPKPDGNWEFIDCKWVEIDKQYEKADFVFYGEVLSLDVLTESTRTIENNNYVDTAGKVIYSIKIHDFIKNSFDDEVISAYGFYYLEKPSETSPDLYKIGDKIEFYIQIFNENESSHEYLIDGVASRIISDDESICGPGTELVEGICAIARTTEPTRTIGSDPSPAMYLGPLILLFGIIGLGVYLLKRREEN